MKPDISPIVSFSFSETELQRVAHEAEGQYACWSYFKSLDSQENLVFKQRLRAKYEEECPVSEPMVNAYTQMHLWRQIVEAIGTFDATEVARQAPGHRIAGPAGEIEILPNHHVRKYACIGRANSIGKFDIIWRSDSSIDPKPWLGIEDYTLTREKLIKKALGLYPDYVHTSNDLEKQIIINKENEKALKQSESKYRQLIHNMREGIWVIDKDYFIIYVNPSMADILGYSVAEMEGKHLFTFMNEHGIETTRTHLERRKHGISERYDCEFVRRDGGTIYANLSAIPRFDEEGKYQGSFAVVEDVTQRRKAEYSLQESEARFRSIADNMRGGILLFERGKGVYANNRAADILGYPQNELLAMNLLDPDVANIESPLGSIVQQIKKSASVSGDIDTWIIRKDGERRYINLRYSSLKQDNRQSLTLFVINDMTELKLAEMKLQDYYEKERELREKIEIQIRRRIEFTHALVHELKTSLTPIVNAGEMLVREVKEDRLSRLAKNVYGGASDLDHRIDELLELARIEVGTLTLKLQPAGILKLIRDAVSYMMPQATNKGQLIKAHLPKSMPSITIDMDRVTQILMNLIGNALKHTAPKSKIAVTAWREGDSITIEVRDNGKGIPEEMQKHLFEPYYQIENSGDHLGGLGLGLSIAKNVVELHGGRMWVRSDVAKGSTFGFSLPLDIKAAIKKGSSGENNENNENIGD